MVPNEMISSCEKVVLQIKGLVDEDFQNYKKCSMFVVFPNCTFKCEKDSGIKCCQNSCLATSPIYDISCEDLVNRYKNNTLSSAIVFGGLEPFDSFNQMFSLIQTIRNNAITDDIIIYTGYKEDEIQYRVKDMVKEFSNQGTIIIKYGRFVPNDEPIKDDILGVTLMSKNQYAKIVTK